MFAFASPNTGSKPSKETLPLTTERAAHPEALDLELFRTRAASAPFLSQFYDMSAPRAHAIGFSLWRSGFFYGFGDTAVFGVHHYELQ